MILEIKSYYLLGIIAVNHILFYDYATSNEYKSYDYKDVAQILKFQIKTNEITQKLVHNLG
ncbi:hypothetical protein DEU40_114101 [Chryseobacterium sp. AG844]|nr:hypothetical protein DEU40_114101 [Chryseobacterium sp. AG844]